MKNGNKKNNALQMDCNRPCKIVDGTRNLAFYNEPKLYSTVDVF